MASKSLQYRGLNVCFEQANLLHRSDGALAVCCDTEMKMSSSICSALVKRAGKKFQTSALAEFKNHPCLYRQRRSVPAAIRVSATGKLRCRYVILLPIKCDFATLATEVLRKMLMSAIQANVRSLAFSPFETDNGCLSDHYELSQSIFDVLKSMPDFGDLATITLVTNDDLDTDQYYDYLNDIIITDQQGENTSTSNNSDQTIPFNVSFKPLSRVEVRKLYYKRVQEKQEEKSINSLSFEPEEDDRVEPCPICLNDMLSNIEHYQDNSDLTIVEIIKCFHRFHRFCLVEWFHNKPICPVCTIPCMDIYGNQPLNGTMQFWNIAMDLEGYPGVGHIRIDYTFPNGIQTDEHPNPGVAYSGTHRTCYLPNNAEGRVVKDLLRIAFNRRLVFTIGQSLTTGRQNTVVWNGIHHKTSLTGGSVAFGYPDPTYLQRVKEELAVFGITESLLAEDEVIVEI